MTYFVRWSELCQQNYKQKNEVFRFFWDTLYSGMQNKMGLRHVLNLTKLKNKQKNKQINKKVILNYDNRCTNNLTLE